MIFNQRVLFDLASELHQLGWFDKEVWTLIAKTTHEKKKINNTHDFNLILNLLNDVNSGGDGKCP